MPIDWHFEPDLSAFVVRLAGDLSLDEVDGVFDSLLSQPEARRRFRVLVELRATTPPTVDIGQAALVRLSRHFPRFDHVQVYIVLARPGGRRSLGRLTSVTFEDKVTVDVFDELTAAITAMTMEELD